MCICVKVFISSVYKFKVYQHLCNPILIFLHYINIPGASQEGMWYRLLSIWGGHLNLESHVGSLPMFGSEGNSILNSGPCQWRWWGEELTEWREGTAGPPLLRGVAYPPPPITDSPPALPGWSWPHISISFLSETCHTSKQQRVQLMPDLCGYRRPG